ncbi:hypothetical protein QEN19_003882 [Hanseniaspora menglaensis]
MLESFAATFLNRFLGSYVENFDANQLEVGIWNGDVKLKNCKIKSDCLDFLDLPVTIKEGVLGNLTMQVPWSRLKSSAVKIGIDDVYLLVEPKSWENYDSKDTFEREFKRKLEKLDQLELTSNNSNLEPESNSSDGFTTSLINKIVDNVQISIENIHIRYEDYDCQFSREETSMGIYLQKLSAKTCNDTWEESFVEIVKNISKKMISLENLGVYIRTGNNVGESFFDEDIDVFIARFKESVVEPILLEQLIHPISGTCKLSINKKGSTTDNPRFDANLDFGSIGLEIFDSQYQALLDIMANAKRFEKSWRFKEIRPSQTPHQDPRRWLEYVITCVTSEIHEKNKPYTWENMKRVSELRRQYTDCWKQKLYSQRDNIVPAKEISSQLDELHKILTLDEIMLFRTIAKKILLKERNADVIKKVDEQKNSSDILVTNGDTESNESFSENAVQGEGQKGWFSSWWGAAENNKPASLLELTDEQKKEFYDAIEYDEDNPDLISSTLPKDRVTLNVVNNLKSGFLKFKSRETNKAIAELFFSNAKTRLFQRPRSFGFQFELNTFSIEDKSSQATYRNIVKVNSFMNDTKEETQMSNEDFFTVYFEKNPLNNEDADSVLNIKLNTMSIYYNAHFINKIAQFFKTSDELHETLAAVISSAGNTVEGWTQQTRLGLEAIIEDHKNIDLNLDLKAPLIILPINANLWDSPCVLIDAGNIKISSDLIPKDKIESIKKLSLEEYQNLEINDEGKIERFMYDRFNISMTNTQLFVGPDIKTTIESLRQSNTGVENSWSIIGRSSMNIIFDVSIFQKALNYPKFKMNLVLPLLKFNLSDYQYRIILQVASIFGFQPSQDEGVFDDVIDLNTNKSIQQFLQAQKNMFAKLTENQLNQKLFDMNVQIDQVSLNLKKRLDTEAESFISICTVTGDQMKLALSKFYQHMDVEFSMKKLLLTENTASNDKKLIYCDKANTEFTELFKVSYIREQRIIKYNDLWIDVYDQTADLSLSSLTINLNSKSIFTVLAYLRNTFTDVSNAPLPTDILRHNDDMNSEESPQKMKVNFNLEEISFIFEEMSDEKLASLSLAESSLSLYMLPEKLKIHGKLKHLELFDLIYENYNSEIRQLILLDDANEFSEFKYETFDCDKTNTDVTSLLEFKASSLKVKFIEQSFGRLIEFFNNLQNMKSIFDKARSITFNNTPDLDTIKKMKLDILVKTPIIEFPSILNPVDNICDNVILYLGQLQLSNDFSKEDITKYKCSLTSMKVTSLLNFLGNKQFLHIIENLDIKLDMAVKNNGENEAKNIDIFGQLSNSEFKITNLQIDYLRNICNTLVSTFNPPNLNFSKKVDNENEHDSIWNVAVNANAVFTPDGVYKAENSEHRNSGPKETQNETSLLPVINIDFNIPIMSLTVYDNTENKAVIDDCSLTKISLNGSKLLLSKDATSNERLKIKYTLDSFAITDLRNEKENVHSDFIPFCSESEHQLAVTYSETIKSGNLLKNSHVILDNMRVILAVDYLISMRVFWNKIIMSPSNIVKTEILSKSQNSQTSIERFDEFNPTTKASNDSFETHFIFEALNPSIVLLATPEYLDSEAFVFKVEHLLLDSLRKDENDISSLNLLNIGMFMCNMKSFNQSHIRLIDDFSSSFYVNKNKDFTKLNLDVEDMIIRVALRDIRLGNKVFRKSLNLATTNGLFGDGLADRLNESCQQGIKFSREFKLALAKYAPSVLSSFTFISEENNDFNNSSLFMKSGFLISDENFIVNFGGGRLVIIGDVSELPMLDFHTDKLQLIIKDWTSDLNFVTDITLNTNIFNYSKSDWEPLIEPFTFNVEGHRGRKNDDAALSDAVMNINITSNNESDITISSQTLALLKKIPESLSLNSISKLVKLSRDETKPFKIRNDTGIPIEVWVHNYRDRNEKTNLTVVSDGETIPWEFEDWIKLRENLDTDNSNSTIAFRALSDDYLSSFKINTKTETQTLFRLEPPIDHIHSRIECNISLSNDGVKLIHFASPLKFTNCTSTDLELFYNEQSSIIIKKQSTHSIPIKEVYNSQYQIKPLTVANEYTRSNEAFKWQDLISCSKKLSLNCLNENTGDYFYFNVSCQYNKKEKLTSVFPHMEIIVSAPFTMENKLPVESHFNIVSKETGENISFNLKSGEILPIHNVNFNNDLVFMKVFPFDSGYVPKDYTLIAAPKRLQISLENKILLTRRENNSINNLKLSIAYKNDPITDCQNIKIFAPYLVLNRTSRAVYFKEKNKTNVFVCPVTTNEQDETYSASQMFSLENAAEANKESSKKNNLTQIKMCDTEWSSPVSLDAVGKDLDLILSIANKTTGNEIGINIVDGTGVFSETKIVTITPRYIITNFTDQNIVFNETMCLTEFLLENSQPIPIYKMSMNEEKFCKLKIYFEDHSEYSEPFDLSIKSDLDYVKLKDPKTNKHVLIKIEKLMDGSTLFINLKNSQENWPFSIRNFTETNFTVYQRDPRVQSSFIKKKTNGNETIEYDQSLSVMSKDIGHYKTMKVFEPKKYSLTDYSVMPFSWDYPSARDKKLIIQCGNVAKTVDLQMIGSLKPLVITKMVNGEKKRQLVEINILADGPTLALVLTKYNPDVSMYKIANFDQLDFAKTSSLSRSSISVDRDSINTSSTDLSSSNSLFKEPSSEKTDIPTLRVLFNVKGVGISLINKRLQEIMYAKIKGIELRYNNSKIYKSVSWKLKWLQVDNQLFEDNFKNVLYPTVVTDRTDDMNSHPVFSGSITRVNDETTGMAYIKHATLLLQEMSLKLNEEFVIEMMQFFKIIDIPNYIGNADINNGLFRSNADDHITPYLDVIKFELEAEKNDDTDVLVNNLSNLSLPVCQKKIERKNLHFENLHMQPTVLHFSFMRSELLQLQDNGMDLIALAQKKKTSSFLNALYMTLGNISDAQVSLNSLITENYKTNVNSLKEDVAKHYSNEIYGQLLKLVGYADVLGNPIGLFNNLSNGVADIFYNPYQDGYYMNDRPEELGISISKGGMSFLKKSVFGFSDSFAKFTSSVAKGLAAATNDRDFQRDRYLQQRRSKLSNDPNKFSSGFSSLVQGVSSGFNGIATNPLEGARKDGTSGFFKGLGKGLVGMPTKTMIGLLDMANNVSDGIKNSTGAYDPTNPYNSKYGHYESMVKSLRYPRYISKGLSFTIDPMDGLIKPYDAREAYGQYLLKTCNSGEFIYDNYVDHEYLPGNQRIVIVSEEHLIELNVENMKVTFKLKMEEICKMGAPVDDGRQIIVRGRDPKTRMISQGRFPIIDLKAKERILTKILLALSKVVKYMDVEL